jgi:hypothetical protein
MTWIDWVCLIWFCGTVLGIAILKSGSDADDRMEEDDFWK